MYYLPDEGAPNCLGAFPAVGWLTTGCDWPYPKGVVAAGVYPWDISRIYSTL